MYFDVVCVVGVVVVVFVVIQDFILAGNNQKYVNRNLREHQKNCLCVSSALFLFNTDFFCLWCCCYLMK